METTDIARTAVPRREIPGEQPELARLSAMVVALLGELAVTRERLDTVERVAEEAGAFTQASVEAYRAQGVAEGERDALRRRLIGVVMQPLKRSAEQASERYRARAGLSGADEILAQE